MSSMGKMVHLRDLCLGLGQIDSKSSLIIHGFRKLRKLYFQGQGVEYLATLIPLAQAMPPGIALEYLEIHDAIVGHCLYAGDIEAESRGLEVLVSKVVQTLTRVFVSLAYHRQAMPLASYAVPSFALLRIFAQLDCLQDLDVELPPSMFVTDDDLRRLQGAWPLLRRMVLIWSEIREARHTQRGWVPSGLYSTGKTPSFHGIIDLIWEHPRVTELMLSSVCISLPGGPVSASCGPRTLPEGLAVPDSRIRDPVVFARIMRSLFPTMHVGEGESTRGGVDEQSKWGIALSHLRCGKYCGHNLRWPQDDPW